METTLTYETNPSSKCLSFFFKHVKFGNLSAVKYKKLHNPAKKCKYFLLMLHKAAKSGCKT